MTERRPTVKECVKHTGRSETWLRKWCCAWCETTALTSLRHGCGAIYEKCDPWAKDYRNMKVAK